MGKKRNSLFQYVKEDLLVIRVPGLKKLLQYAIVLLIFSPWIIVSLFRIDIKELFLSFMNYVFKIEPKDPKATAKNGFF